MERAVHRQRVLLGHIQIPVQFPYRPIWWPIRNASQVSDGAAAVLLMKRSMALHRGLPILGVFRSFAAVGVQPSVMGIGPAVDIPAAVKSAGLELDDIDLFEINEAFASQFVYSIKKLGLDPGKVNVNTKAIPFSKCPDGLWKVDQLLSKDGR